VEYAFILFVLVGAAIAAYQWWEYRKKREAYAILLASHGLQPTTRPCGLDAERLHRLRACPKGDRRYGVEYGATGPTTVTIAGREHELECAGFRWWWEVRQTQRDSNGHTRTTYSKRTVVVGAIRLPATVPMVSIAPERLLARLGIGGRGDFQVESAEFNRRFDIRTHEDPRLVIRLFDAQFQRFLIEMFDGRSIEFRHDVLLVAGEPQGRHADLYGDIGRLPAARRDAALIASRIPASFWRGLATRTQAPS
jgi:hypothetical protein